MRALRLPLLLLTALLLLGLFCSRRTGDLCRDWLEQLAVIDEAAQQERWEDIHQQLTDLQTSWESRRLWLRITLPHQDLESAEALLRRCLFLTRERDSADLRAALSDLTCQLEHMAGTEQLSVENIW